jgi:hypothetical protein
MCRAVHRAAHAVEALQYYAAFTAYAHGSTGGTAADVLPALHAVQCGEVPPGTGKPSFFTSRARRCHRHMCSISWTKLRFLSLHSSRLASLLA